MNTWEPCEESALSARPLVSRSGQYLIGLADALRAYGCQVIETEGWRTRGHGPILDVRGILVHHTGGGGDHDWIVVRDGRADLAGPLAHLTLERDGTFRVIAAGLCWHAGGADNTAIAQRMGCGINDGNQHLIGIEGVSNGSTWTDAQRRAYPRGVAALARAGGLTSARVLGHKEWAPSRKPDPGQIDMVTFRIDVDRILTTGPPRQRTGDQYMSQGTLPPCDLDKSGDPLPRRAYFCATTGPAGSLLTNRTWFSLATGWDDADCRIWFIGTARAKTGTGAIPVYFQDFSVTLPKNCRQWWQVPDNTDQIAVEYRSKNPVGWEIEKEPK